MWAVSSIPAEKQSEMKMKNEPEMWIVAIRFWMWNSGGATMTTNIVIFRAVRLLLVWWREERERMGNSFVHGKSVYLSLLCINTISWNNLFFYHLIHIYYLHNARCARAIAQCTVSAVWCRGDEAQTSANKSHHYHMMENVVWKWNEN